MTPRDPAGDTTPNDSDDPFTAAVLRLLPRIRAIAHARLRQQLKGIVSSADIAQSACRQLLAQRGRIEFRGDGPLMALIDVVVRRKIREKLRAAGAARREAKRCAAFGDLDHLAEDDQQTPIDLLIQRERSALLAFHIDRLADRDAEALMLRHVLALGQEEIAAHLGLTLAATRNLLHRARGRLGAAVRRSDAFAG